MGSLTDPEITMFRAGSQNWGTTQTLALCLAVIGGRVSRATLRNVLDVMRRRAGHNGSPRARKWVMKEALRKFEERGWVSRSRYFVLVTDRRALMEYVAQADVDEELRAATLRHIRDVVTQLDSSLARAYRAAEGQERRVGNLSRLATERPHGKEVLS
jgi:hypothetical protein